MGYYEETIIVHSSLMLINIIQFLLLINNFIFIFSIFAKTILE